MNEGQDYVAVRPCGCVAAWASVEYENDRRALAKILSEWIKGGYSVERASTEDARRRFMCPHLAQAPAAPVTLPLFP